MTSKLFLLAAAVVAASLAQGFAVEPLLSFDQGHRRRSLVQAQAACTGLTPGGGWVSAVPRACFGRETCDSICSKVGTNAPDPQRRSKTSHTCVTTLHLYTNPESTQYSFPGLKTRKYNTGCARADCGPNICCCLSV